ncbi:MAG: MFS transporter, partial [Alistipes sp.]
MGLLAKIGRFYAISSPSAATVDAASEQGQRYYRRLALQSFAAATLGYSLYYVCRTSLNVMKKPIIDNGILDAAQLGYIGSALLIAYAVGKFVNGFVADYCNIKKFMATGLIVSTLANFIMGVLGLASGITAITTSVMFVVFAVMWGVNGWAQSMGAPPAIISLSRWFPLSRRGTFYGFFSASHNLGEWFSFVFVGQVVEIAGWQWGFFGSAMAGVIGVAIVLWFLHDTPESKGLPAIEVLSHESKPTDAERESTKAIQRQVLRSPAVWILAAASAFMYVSRYSLNSWGVLFLQEAKGFAMGDATFI